MRAFILMLTILSAYSTLAQIQASDCNEAIRICSKEPVIFDLLHGAGNESQEVGITTCHSSSFPETNSAWITWRIQKQGTMQFSIIPIDENDDVDFVLYQNDDINNNCFAKREIRCSASGENLGEAESEVPVNNCLGITGIRMGVTDNSERQGCTVSDDNFLEGVNASVGNVYTIFINNYSSDRGFAFELSGTAELDPTINDCLGDVSGTGFINESEIQISDIFPNPATSEIVTEINVPTQAEGEVFVFNNTGQITYQVKRFFTPGAQTLSVDVSAYTPGVYFMKIRIGEHTWLSDFNKQ